MLNRRQVLAAMASALFVPNIPACCGEGDQTNFGLLPKPPVDPRTRFFSTAASDLEGTGKGKIALLYKYMEKVTGKPVRPHHQSSKVGDCVGHTYALGVDILNCVQIKLKNKPYIWRAEVSDEFIYAGAREISGNLDGPDGTNGVHASKFIRKYGTLVRQKYLGLYDLSKYSPALARKWGKDGIPTILKPIAKLHPVKTTAMVTSYDQARDSIVNGYPVAICSSQGFCRECGRDKQGFMHPKGIWTHSMLLAGIDDKSSRKGGLLINCWGSNWVRGEKQLGQPNGSFWVEKETLDEMLRWNDSYSLSNYRGYRRQRLNFDLI